MRELPIVYPAARSSATREQFHGIEIADPFDWLEDKQHPQVRAWLAAQRHLTEQQLSSLPARGRVLESLDANAPALKGTKPDPAAPRDLWVCHKSAAICGDQRGVMCEPEAIDAAMRDGLGPRWALYGVFATSHLNALGGIREYYTKFPGLLEKVLQCLHAGPCIPDAALTEVIAADLERRLSANEVPARRCVVHALPFDAGISSRGTNARMDRR
jgi:Prolyl oligopeptidase, N-terminal beta-propeller domain